MDREHFKEYFDTLEIHPDSTFNEIVRAYNHLKNLYSLDSIATMPLDSELSKSQRESILRQINDAFSALNEMMKEEELERERKKVEQNQPDYELNGDQAYSGVYFQEVRHKKGIKLQDLSFMTKISKHTLTNIEKENYRELPPDGYLRWHVKTYAKFLGLDPDEASNEYMRRYRLWKRHIVQK